MICTLHKCAKMHGNRWFSCMLPYVKKLYRWLLNQNRSCRDIYCKFYIQRIQILTFSSAHRFYNVFVDAHCCLYELKCTFSHSPTKKKEIWKCQSERNIEWRKCKCCTWAQIKSHEKKTETKKSVKRSKQVKNKQTSIRTSGGKQRDG